MTTRELNQDWKKLNQHLNTLALDFSKDEKTYYSILEVYKKEFKKLYYSDDTFKYANKKSILIALRLNLKHRIIPFHQFGINIDLI